MITEAGNKAWPLERMLCLLCANQLPHHLFTARIAVEIPLQVTQRIVKPILGYGTPMVAYSLSSLPLPSHSFYWRLVNK